MMFNIYISSLTSTENIDLFLVLEDEIGGQENPYCLSLDL